MKKSTAALAVSVVLGAAVLTGCADDDNTECQTFTTIAAAPAPRPAPAPAPRPAPAPKLNTPQAPPRNATPTQPVQPHSPRTSTTCWERDDR